MAYSNAKDKGNDPSPIPLPQGEGVRRGAIDEVPHERFMDMALKEAALAAERGEVPVGAVAVIDNEVIARGHNLRESLNDPTAHAEVIVIREAALRLNRWRLSDVTLYVTIEPCAMCAGAIVLARIPSVVFGARDPKGGGCGSVFQILQEPGLNHKVEIVEGIKKAECQGILQDFFGRRRSVYPSSS